MQLVTILLLAVGLAMDAAAVALVRGFAARSLRASDVASIALMFGGFQAAMPALGLVVGRALGRFAEAWDHWIAFVLLSVIGLKMLKESWSGGDELDAGERVSFGLRALLPLAIATSIDALAAGITLPSLDVSPVLAIATIGIVTALLSALGVLAGRRFGAYFGPRLDALGGFILIGLGIKTLIEHLS
jgi:putative Mn2+ efflux pump MntP